jgi:adenylate kinase
MTRRVLLLALATLAAVAAQSGAKNSPLILLIGPPGAGKTSQAEFLNKTYGMPILSIDDLIRADPASLSRNRNPQLRGMEPHSDPALNAIFERTIARMDLSKGLVLDGYPATKEHADFLAKWVQERELPQPIVLQLDVPDGVVRQRAGSSMSPETLEQRLKDYRREMELIGLYFPTVKIDKIDGTRKPAQVSKEIRKVVDKRKKGS